MDKSYKHSFKIMIPIIIFGGLMTQIVHRVLTLISVTFPKQLAVTDNNVQRATAVPRELQRKTLLGSIHIK